MRGSQGPRLCPPATACAFYFGLGFLVRPEFCRRCRNSAQPTYLKYSRLTGGQNNPLSSRDHQSFEPQSVNLYKNNRARTYARWLKQKGVVRKQTDHRRRTFEQTLLEAKEPGDSLAVAGQCREPHLPVQPRQMQ